MSRWEMNFGWRQPKRMTTEEGNIMLFVNGILGDCMKKVQCAP
ncbi:hypothetical protein M493_02075 [Geobacillus genomosp. 3]|uniref:Uncharacterized protein n=1 Tax=Geobacillus genomosp. 3 TaxID=1921421 RepID=S5YVN6_GEOG3|nr:hypothetical protein M493_02075 [Geobacillus genomosp. 3]